jgi:hypothetical protein
MGRRMEKVGGRIQEVGKAESGYRRLETKSDSHENIAR